MTVICTHAEIETAELDLCPHCGAPWPITETLLPDGELGCPCRVCEVAEATNSDLCEGCLVATVAART